MMKPNLLIRETPQELIEVAAQKIVTAARESIAARGIFSIVLAGGSTPGALYELLTQPAWREQIDWKRTRVFFGDERAAPPDSDLSNFRMAQNKLLSRVPLPATNIHRMEAERDDLENAARDYEVLLREYSPLDLVLLGMGGDGHTASLFPNSPALEEENKLCVATPVASQEPHVRRLTLTFPAINSARRVWILVTGQSKAARVQQVLETKSPVRSTPIAGVAPQSGKLIWMLDKDAAAHLENTSR
jgi:6-phosphogluconolactonase